MKKFSPPWRLILCLFLLAALFATGCEKEPEYTQRPALVVQEEVTTTSEWLVLAVENLTDGTVAYSESYPHHLQKREESGWIDIPLTEHGKNTVTHENQRIGPASGETDTFYIPIVNYYGDFLPVGEYRLLFNYKLCYFEEKLTQAIDDAWYFLILK